MAQSFEPALIDLPDRARHAAPDVEDDIAR